MDEILLVSKEYALLQQVKSDFFNYLILQMPHNNYVDEETIMKSLKWNFTSLIEENNPA
jgi:hypothetical protein